MKAELVANDLGFSANQRVAAASSRPTRWTAPTVSLTSYGPASWLATKYTNAGPLGHMQDIIDNLWMGVSAHWERREPAEKQPRARWKKA